MTFHRFREYCLTKKAVSESFPFGEEVLVFKVMDKMFALCNVEQLPLSFNLKCDPARALELREQYEAVQPGYHMNKKHWNTVVVDGSLSDTELYELIDHSYHLVVARLPKTVQAQLSEL